MAGRGWVQGSLLAAHCPTAHESQAQAVWPIAVQSNNVLHDLISPSAPHFLPASQPQFYKKREPRRWVTSGGLGSMGFGLPSALGAAAAFDGKNGRPKKIVVDIDGDGRHAFML